MDDFYKLSYDVLSCNSLYSQKKVFLINRIVNSVLRLNINCNNINITLILSFVQAGAMFSIKLY